MNRRGFIGALAAAVLSSDRARAVDACARLRLDFEDAGRPVAPDFVGLSYESALLNLRSYFDPSNRSLIGLIRRLSPNGVLRIGGNTSERTVFGRGVEPASRGSFAIEPADIDRLAATLHELGWKLIYGLNLARGSPESAAEEAAYVARAVGPRLLAFQISNEPDGFGRWARVRPSGYDFATFLNEWKPFQSTIRERLPNAAFAGPDVAAETGWVPAFARAAPDGLVLLTRHYYADGPASDPHVTLANLLRSAPQVEPILASLAQTSSRYNLPFRIAEANSVFQGGRPGVSDTLGAALWGLELMFQIAAAGGVGVNFHSGFDKVYTPIGGAAAPHRARPLYYGMLLFAQACRGALLPVHLDAISGQDGGSRSLAAFAAREDATLRVVLINKDAAQGCCVEIDPRRRFRTANALRLLGPSIDARSGVTLGGAEVDTLGGWSASDVERINADDTTIVFQIPAASAALISLEA
jgi:hypothetical protein